MLPWFRLASATRVDTGSRRVAARLLREWVNRSITNDQLADAWPRSHDRALGDIWAMVWGTFDDLSEHRFSGDGSGLLIRCAAFLETDQPYVWRQPRLLLRLLLVPVGLLSLGAVGRLFDDPPPSWPRGPHLSKEPDA